MQNLDTIEQLSTSANKNIFLNNQKIPLRKWTVKEDVYSSNDAVFCPLFSYWIKEVFQVFVSNL